jgi:hypothetical protein
LLNRNDRRILTAHSLKPTSIMPNTAYQEGI